MDLTVRSPDQVLPENVKRDLPRAAKAIRSRGLLEIGWITTAIDNPVSPYAGDILATLADLGIPQFKLGYFRYGEVGELRGRIDEVRALLRGIESHHGPALSATTHVAHLLLEGINPAPMGFYPD